MTIGRISLCDTLLESCSKALQLALKFCWWFFIFEDVMARKLKILLNFASNVSSIMNTDYFSFLDGRVSKYLHFIFWSQFWNINHERIMDMFCHFSSLTWPIYLGFLLIQFQLKFQLKYHWTCWTRFPHLLLQKQWSIAIR